MTYRQLEVFLAVVEAGGFSQGARHLLVAQSTVSQHIAELERELGVRLLERSGKRIRPTEAGRLLVQQARRLAGAMRDAESALHRYRELEEASLRVGASSVPGNHLVPTVLHRLVERFPGISMTVLLGDSRETIERLLRDEVELGVVGSRLAETRLSFVRIGGDRLRLIVSPRHRWAGRRRVGLTELKGEPLVLREVGSGTGRTIEEALRKRGVDVGALRIRARVGSNEAVKNAVAVDVGVSLVSELSVRREVAAGDLVALDVSSLPMTRSFFLARRPGSELSPAATVFVRALRDGWATGGKRHQL